MRPVSESSAEMFRFQYDVEGGSSRRFRVVLHNNDILYFIAEQKEADGWDVVNQQAIDYCEYSDENLEFRPHQRSRR